MINPALCSQALLVQRPQIVHLALKYGAAFGLRDDTMYDGLQLFDRVSCCGAPVNVAAWPLMLCSCLLLAARQVESPGLWPQLEQASGDARVVSVGFAGKGAEYTPGLWWGWARGGTRCNGTPAHS